MLSRGLLIAVAAIASCSFEPDYGETRYICKLDRCPEGYVCVDEICVTGASDASVDGAAPDGPVDSGPASCDDLFGVAPEYELCEDSPTTCTFGAHLDGISCDAMCEMFASTCESAQDSDSGALCVPVGASGCDATHSRAICTCVR